MAYDLPRKAYEYTGIVISSVNDEQSDQTDLVLLLKSDRENAEKISIYGVTNEAFLPPTVEHDFIHVDRAKNIERRFATPLKFGDTVQWNNEDCDHSRRIIWSIYREKPIFPASSDSSGHILRVGGVIKPNKPTSFWTTLGTLAIPVQEALRAEPDVWLNAWVRFETNMMTSADPANLVMTFVKFDDFDAGEQGRVCQAPWHKASIESKFTVWAAEPSPCDSDDEIACEPPASRVFVENKWCEVIRKQLGLYVGDRLIICKELPQYDFIIPLLSPLTIANDEKTLIYPTVGEYYHFAAIWSNNHRSYLVRDIMPVPMLRSHQITANGNMCVRVMHAMERGLFIDHEESLGLIDDPMQTLSFLKFHPMSYESIRVTVEIRAVRSCENRSVRYRIVRPIKDDDVVDQFFNWLRIANFTVGPITGMLINRDTVISATHPNIYFRLQLSPGEQPPPLGAGLRFRAIRHMDYNSEMHIVEWLIDRDSSARKVVEGSGERIFQVMLKAVPGQEQLAYSDVLGCIDTRTSNHPNSTGELYPAWIRESPFEGECRRAATIVEVYSTSVNPPRLQPRSSTSSGDDTKSSFPFTGGSRHGSHHGSHSSHNSSSSLTSHRFVGPTRQQASASNSSFSSKNLK